MKRKLPLNIYNLIFTLIIISFLALMQSSFLFYPFFFTTSLIPLVIFAFLYNIIEPPHNIEGFFISGLCGFWLDTFSSSLMGVYTLIFLISTIFIKIILNRYVKFFSFS